MAAERTVFQPPKPSITGRWRSIAVDNRKPTRRSRLAAWLAETRPRAIDPELVPAIRERLAPVSASHLRHLLRECGIPLSPLVEGVRQDSLEQLERTLAALAAEYPRHRQACRRLVIEAKDHARWARRRGSDKQEMIQWMLVWLENPEVFQTWAALRKKQITEFRSTPPE